MITTVLPGPTYVALADRVVRFPTHPNPWLVPLVDVGHCSLRWNSVQAATHYREMAIGTAIPSPDLSTWTVQTRWKVKDGWWVSGDWRRSPGPNGKLILVGALLLPPCDGERMGLPQSQVDGSTEG